MPLDWHGFLVFQAPLKLQNLGPAQSESPVQWLSSQHSLDAFRMRLLASLLHVAAATYLKTPALPLMREHDMSSCAALQQKVCKRMPHAAGGTTEIKKVKLDHACVLWQTWASVMAMPSRRERRPRSRPRDQTVRILDWQLFAARLMTFVPAPLLRCFGASTHQMSFSSCIRLLLDFIHAAPTCVFLRRPSLPFSFSLA